MRQDVALLALLGSLWLGCFSLHVWKMARGTLFWVPVQVRGASGPEDHPVVQGFLASEARPESGLAVGDRLLRIGERDLRGAGRLDFLVAAHAQAPRAALRIERDGARLERRLALEPFTWPWRTLPFALGAGVLGLIVLARGAGTKSARLFAMAGVAWSLHWSLFLGGPAWQTLLSLGVTLGSAALFQPLALLALASLGEGPALRRQTRLLPWLFAGYLPAASSWLLGVPFPSEVGLRLTMAANLAFCAAALALLALGFRRADALGRRQLKWVVLGFYLGLAPLAVAAVASWWEPRFVPVYERSTLAAVAIPAGFYLAIVRYRFGDVDRLLSAATSYSIACVLLLALLLTTVPLLGARLAAATGLEPTTAQLLLSLAGAALAVPGQRWLRPRVEQRFLPERRALERALASSDVGAPEGSSPPLTRLGETLQRLLEPDACVVYGRGGGRFVPVFATGPSVAPAFEARGTLAKLLAERAAPVDRTLWRRWTRQHPLSPGDRAALESMGPELLLPLRRDAELAGFVCLGAKGSGDIYTSTEQGWLAALAERASGALARLDDGAVLRESQALQEALRSYVPEAVARELAEGRELQPSEREVSVLFADLRDYTDYAHSRQAREIFSTVNQYTQAVSGVVRAHAGTVVEFHGDGLMAVFGAPGELPHKERAALRAAGEIVAAVAELGVARADGTPLSVGVGVATGTAFVGSLESVERRIWSAIGNTTNLAARLQSLTRDLDVAVAIDEATWRAGGSAATGFERRPRVRIRGRGDPEDVFVLALPRARKAARV